MKEDFGDNKIKYLISFAEFNWNNNNENNGLSDVICTQLMSIKEYEGAQIFC